MTPFELYMVCIGAAGLLVAFGGVVFAGAQLRRIAESNQLSADANRNADLMAVLALETQLAGARFEVAKVSAKVGTLGQNPDPTAAEFLQLEFDEANEQYLNVADRLCSCIIRGFIDEGIYRRDYRRWISEIVERYSTELGPGTRYSNIMKVHDAWNEDRSAQEPVGPPLPSQQPKGLLSVR